MRNRRLTDRMRERRNTWRQQRAALRAARRGASGYGTYVAATRHVDRQPRKGWLAATLAVVAATFARFTTRRHYGRRGNA